MGSDTAIACEMCKRHERESCRNSRSERLHWRTVQRRAAQEQRQLAELGLTKFETLDDCRRRNAQVARALNRAGIYLPLPHCGLELCTGPEARAQPASCWLAMRQARLDLIPRAAELMRTDNGPVHHVTVVRPKDQYEPGQLHRCRLTGIRQWVQKILAGLRAEAPELKAFGGIDTSFNVERDGCGRWQLHVHVVIAGPPAENLKAAQWVKQREASVRHSKVRQVKRIPEAELHERLGYAFNRFFQQRIAYVGTNGRMQRRQLPLSPAQQAELEAWLTTLRVSDRLIVSGMKWNRSRLVPA